MTIHKFIAIYYHLLSYDSNLPILFRVINSTIEVFDGRYHAAAFSKLLQSTATNIFTEIDSIKNKFDYWFSGDIMNPNDDILELYEYFQSLIQIGNEIKSTIDEVGNSNRIVQPVQSKKSKVHSEEKTETVPQIKKENDNIGKDKDEVNIFYLESLTLKEENNTKETE